MVQVETPAQAWRCVLLVALSLPMPSFPLPALPETAAPRAGGRWGAFMGRACAPLGALRGGSMPGIGGPGSPGMGGFGGLGMDAIDRIMTPEMIRGAANMMSNMDPGLLNSMMSMTGMPAPPDFDAAELKRATEKLKGMTPDEIMAVKNGACKDPLLRGGAQGWSPEAEQLLRRAERLKEEGNALHANQDYDTAAAKYTAARADLSTVQGWPKAASLARSCLLNEASCHMQRGRWKEVEQMCSAVLASDSRNLKALYRRGLAYLRQAEHTKADSTLDALVDEADASASTGDPIERAKALLVRAYKDVGAARSLDASDSLVEATFADIKTAMDAVDLDWAGIPLDLPAPPSPQLPLPGAWAGVGSGTAEAKTRALAQRVAQNASAVREGAGVLASLDSMLVAELVGGAAPDEAAEAVMLLKDMRDEDIKVCSCLRHSRYMRVHVRVLVSRHTEVLRLTGGLINPLCQGGGGSCEHATSQGRGAPDQQHAARRGRGSLCQLVWRYGRATGTGCRRGRGRLGRAR